MRAVSFSLYGDAAIYAVGAIENVKLVKKHYPGWDCVVHVEHGHYAARRLQREGAVVIEHPKGRGAYGMKWRIETAAMGRYDVVIFRDADSRIDERERASVEEWLESGRALHTMHDHAMHRHPVMAGMWGIRTGRFDVRPMLDRWKANPEYAYDEKMLARFVWKNIGHDSIRHGTDHPFPRPRVRPFIGEKVTPRFGPETRFVLLSAEHYHERRERFYESLSSNGGFLNLLECEWWKGTPKESLLAPPSFRQVNRRDHWWAASHDHMRIMEDTLLGDWEQLILVEDDAHFVDGFDERFWRSWCVLPEGWKAMRMGWHDHCKHENIVPGLLNRCDNRSGLQIANLWSREGLLRFYDHAWHRRKLIIDMAFADLRKREPRDWYQPIAPIVVNDPKARQRGRDK